MRRLLLGCLLAGVLATVVHAQSRPGTWRAVGLGPDDAGFLGSAGAAAVGRDGSAVVAGPFVAEGGAVESGVARWDGVRWHPLGAPPNAVVTAVTFAHDGTIVAAGRFTEIGGVAARGIARWGGVAWHPLGSGLAPASDVALTAGPDGSVVAVGGFTTAGGVPAAGAARWTGTDWEALPDAGSPIRSAIFGADGRVYATIRPDPSAPIDVVRLADGRWEALPSPPVQIEDPLVSDPGGAFVASSWTGAGWRGLVRWTGSEWTDLGGLPSGSEVCAVAASPEGDLFMITGHEYECVYVRRFRDGAWADLGFTWGVTGAVGAPGGFLATGPFQLLGDLWAEYVARYDHNGWHPVGPGLGPDGFVTGLHALPGGGAVATGSFTRIGGVPARGIARWDGAIWHPLGDGVENASGAAGGVHDVAVAPDGRIVAVGPFARAGGGVAPGVAVWDGAAWSALPALGGGDGAHPTAATFTSDGALVVARRRATGEVFYSTVLRLDGDAWTPLGDSLRGDFGDSVFRLTAGPDGALYASGAVRAAGAEPARNVVRWDGTAWRAVGAIGGQYVSDLVVAPDGRPVAVGSGGILPPAAPPGAAAWDGTSWELLGGPFTGQLRPDALTTVKAAALDGDGAIVVAGNFTEAGGAPARGLAWWDGAAWTGTEDGPDAPLWAVAPLTDGGALVAGDHARADGRPAPRIAWFDADVVATEPGPTGGLALSVGPNPSAGQAMAWLSGTGPARVEVTDALGRRIAVSFDGLGAGRTAVPLPSGLPPGVYAVRAVSGRHAQTVRWVVVR